MTTALKTRRRELHAANTRSFSADGAKVMLMAYRGNKHASVAGGFEFKPGFIYCAVRAITARINQNWDGWPSSELKKSYRSFLGKPCFVNHQNFDPKKARGKVVASRYVEAGDDKYIETVMEIDAQRFPKLAKEIKDGGMDSVSMGVEAGFTICSYCGNRAVDVPEFCEHVKYHKGQKLGRINKKTGTVEPVLVYEKCFKLGFFELSFVFDPADETAVVSRVIAANNRYAQDEIPSGIMVDPMPTEMPSQGMMPTEIPPSGVMPMASLERRIHRLAFEISEPPEEVEDAQFQNYTPSPKELQTPSMDNDKRLDRAQQGGIPMPTRNSRRRPRYAQGDPMEALLGGGGGAPPPDGGGGDPMAALLGGGGGAPPPDDGGGGGQSDEELIQEAEADLQAAEAEEGGGEGAPPEEDEEGYPEDEGEEEDDLGEEDEGMLPGEEEPEEGEEELPPEEGGGGEELPPWLGGGGEEEEGPPPPPEMTARRRAALDPRDEGPSRDYRGHSVSRHRGNGMYSTFLEGRGQHSADTLGGIKGIIDDHLSSQRNGNYRGSTQKKRRARRGVPMSLAQRTRVASAQRPRHHYADDSGHFDGGPFGEDNQGQWEDTGVMLSDTPPAEAVAAPTPGDGTISNTENNLVARIQRRSNELRRDVIAYEQITGRRIRGGPDDDMGSDPIGGSTQGGPGDIGGYPMQKGSPEGEFLPGVGAGTTQQGGPGIGPEGGPGVSKNLFDYGQTPGAATAGGDHIHAGRRYYADAVAPIEGVHPDPNTGSEGASVAQADEEQSLGDGVGVATHPKDASVRAFRAFDQWLRQTTGKTARQHGNSNFIRRSAARFCSARGMDPAAMFPALGIVLREARRYEGTNRRANMRRYADETMDVAAPQDRIDVEAPVKNTTDALAQASQPDLSDFGGNASDNLADPELGVDSQIWAPGEGDSSTKSSNRKADGITAVRYAEAYIRAGLAPNSPEEKWKIAGLAQTMRLGTIRDRIALLDAVNQQRVASTRRTAGINRGGGSSVPPGFGNRQMTAGAVNDYTTDSAMFLK